MGGRGGASASSGGMGAATDTFRAAGTEFLNTDELDPQALEVTLQAVSDVFEDMGLPLDTVTLVEGYNLGPRATAAVDGFNHLTLNTDVFSDYSAAEESMADEGGLWTSNGKTVHQYTAYGVYGTAAHEAGHLVMNQVTKREYSDRSNLERSTARKNGTVEKQIIKEASSRYGSNPGISWYGRTNASEKVAEAVADVYTNKGAADPYSQVIVDVVKEHLG